nr:hypothetical protein [Tanacetum cinerariifolium]
MIIEEEIRGHFIHRMYVDGGSASEILYKHFFNRLRPKIKNQMVPVAAPLIVRSSSPYNGIIGRTGVRKIQAVSSTANGMLKFPLVGGILTLKSNKIIPIECAAVLGSEGQPPTAHQTIEERIKVAINPDYPEQTIIIGSTLTEEGRNKLCDLLQRNLNVFSWKPADMTGVPRHIAEHRLNILEGCPPVKQKRRGQAADKNQAIQKEDEKLVDAGIMKEVHCHSWLSNPTERWNPFADSPLNALWMHIRVTTIKKAKEDEEKTSFITSQRIFCYSKMPFGLRNAEAKYQRLVDKAFHKQIGRSLEDVQKLNGKLASLNRFLAKSAEKSLAFFKTLKKCTKKSDFHWTEEAESAFKQMKQLIAELPTLTTPEEKKELTIYLAATKEAVSAVLMTEREAKQMLIYIVSRTLRGPEVNHTSMEKLFLALGQILADFIVERPKEDSLDTPMEVEEELLEPYILFTDGSSSADGSRAGLILTNLEGAEFTYALSVSIPPTKGNFNIPFAVDETACIFLSPGLPMIPLYGDDDLTITKFIKPRLNVLRLQSLPVVILP